MTAMTKGAFVIDSWNIHRLVIAGVTVASKFFSDVFYTNSRYAKVITFPYSVNKFDLTFRIGWWYLATRIESAGATVSLFE